MNREREFEESVKIARGCLFACALSLLIFLAIIALVGWVL